jgi:hypothetical protein
MTKVKLSSRQNHAGRTLIVPPPVSSVTFDKDNVIEVDEKDAAQLVADTVGSIDLFYVDKEKQKEADQSNDNAGGDQSGSEVSEEDAEKLKALEEQIESASTEQLLELVKASVTDQGELTVLSGYSDRKLKNYLRKKIGLPAKTR